LARFSLYTLMPDRETRPQILLVEESPTDRALLERALRNCTTVALDADAALAAAHRQSFAAILVADALPGRRGRDVLRELRTTVGETPIVFMTNGADEGLGEAARAAGAAWIVKDPGFEEAIVSLLGVVTPLATVAPDAAPCDLVLLDLDGQRHAVRAADVEMVARAVTIAPVPGAPLGVEGCIVYRGQLVTVLDLRGRLRLPAKPLDESQHFVILRTGGRLLVVRVDRAIEVVRLESGLRLPDGCDGAGGTVLGVAQLPDGPVVVYDVAALAASACPVAAGGPALP
jgi:chemotaxis signal transduction protein/CheY-like chemotaxis protein